MLVAVLLAAVAPYPAVADMIQEREGPKRGIQLKLNEGGVQTARYLCKRQFTRKR